MRSLVRFSFLAALTIMLTTMTVRGQDFSRTFQLGPDSPIKIHNVSGDIVVTGYDGNVIVVSGQKAGRDSELVQIEDRSTAGSVDVGVKYPDNCNCDASIKFEVRVPRAIRYRFDSISTVSGSVAVSDVSGDLRARSVSGEVTVKSVNGNTNASSVSGRVIVDEAAGSVSAKSTSGEVRVVITRLQGADAMEFASVSGSVNVKLPANLDANVEMSVLSGELKTDFPLQIEDKGKGPGQKATGQVGAGSRKLRLSSVSGSVSLLKL